ncbi:hypothetical protein Tco_1218085 [Tanacetum coccineum]
MMICRLYLTIAQMKIKKGLKILDRKYPIIDWKTECFGTKPQPDEAKSIEEINLNVSSLGDLMFCSNPEEQDELFELDSMKEIIKKKYPLKKEILVQMLNLILESEEESTMALELIRFIKKIIMLAIKDAPLSTFTVENVVSLFGWLRLRISTHRTEIVQETTEKIIQVKQRMQAARDRQKSYAEIEAFVGPFKVIKRVGDVSYKLELSRVHNTFHVSNLKKCHADEPLAVPLDGLHFDDKLQFVEEPIEITDREVKRLKRSRIPLVKVRWNSKRGPEFTWEREDQFRKKYPHLFSKTGPSSSAAS